MFTLATESTTFCQKWPTMASLRLQQPSPFNFCTLDEWPQLEEVFEQFSPALGMSVEAKEEQISILQYYMDEDVNDTLTSLNITSSISLSS